jgi:hypothetical protein
MILFAGKRSLLVLLRGVGSPPPPPRRYFSKSWGYDDYPAAWGGAANGRHYGQHRYRWRGVGGRMSVTGRALRS